jgi:aspartate aminotransferase
MRNSDPQETGSTPQNAERPSPPWGAPHLSMAVRGLKPSPTVAINERSDALRREGRHIFKLGLGQSPFPVPDPVVESLREFAREKAYLPVKGLPELRAAVAAYEHRTIELECSGEDVMIAPGSKELMFLLQVAFYGDLVVPTPAWVSYAPQANILQRTVEFLPMREADGWRLDPDELAAVCREDAARPRILILNYPSNPAGTTYDADHLGRIAAVAREYGLIVLSDEIYGELHFEGRQPSIATAYPEGTIVSTGLSKWCGAGGWRLGAFVFPRQLRWLQEAMAAVASESYTATSAPIQYAAITAFVGGPEISDYLRRARRILAALGSFVTRTLRAAGVTLPDPEGGFYVFVDFENHREALAARGIKTSPQLAERLLEDTGVALLPGNAFGRAKDELTVRIAYVDFDGDAAMKALADDGGLPADAWLRARCGGVVTAIERIADWWA